MHTEVKPFVSGDDLLQVATDQAIMSKEAEQELLSSAKYCSANRVLISCAVKNYVIARNLVVLLESDGGLACHEVWGEYARGLNNLLSAISSGLGQDGSKVYLQHANAHFRRAAIYSAWSLMRASVGDLKAERRKLGSLWRTAIDPKQFDSVLKSFAGLNSDLKKAAKRVYGDGNLQGSHGDGFDEIDIDSFVRLAVNARKLLVDARERRDNSSLSRGGWLLEGIFFTAIIALLFNEFVFSVS